MNIEAAKGKLDQVIRKSRVHFYKPFQIAEILHRNRLGDIDDLGDVESYRLRSKQWRDEVSRHLVGRKSTSSSKFQDNLFDKNACPPEAIVELGKLNRATDGLVEAYVYRSFESRLGEVSEIVAGLREASPQSFDLQLFVDSFRHKSGLARSIDKAFEVVVYALVATVVRALDVRVSVELGRNKKNLKAHFQDFLAKVVGIGVGSSSTELIAKVYRVGATNAADRGLDMIANFGLAIQVKHISMDAEEVIDICDGVAADRIVVVCKDADAGTIFAVLAQIGLDDRIQSIVTFSDLKRWYDVCLSEQYRDSLGVRLLSDLEREFVAEFPSFGAISHFMRERGYDNIVLDGVWAIEAED